MRFVSEDEENGSNKPHPDYETNLAQFKRMMQNVFWESEFMHEINAPDGKMFATYKISNVCVIFTFGIKGKYQRSGVISLHQKNKDFQKREGFAYELAAFLNFLGSNGFLVHRKKENNGIRRCFMLQEQEMGERLPDAAKNEEQFFNKDGDVCTTAVWVTRKTPTNPSHLPQDRFV